MIAGRMKYRLTLLEPTRTTDRFGAEAVDYVDIGTVPAERVSMSGRRSEEVGEHFADYEAKFNIRHHVPVSEGWRVQQLGGHLYNVMAIIPNLDRGYKTLVCVRPND